MRRINDLQNEVLKEKNNKIAKLNKQIYNLRKSNNKFKNNKY